MPRSRWVPAVLVLAAAGLLAPDAGPGGRDGRFVLRHADADLDAFPFVPVEGSRYERLRVVALDGQGEEVDRSFNGTLPARGIRSQDGTPVVLLEFQEGVAVLTGCILELPVQLQVAGGEWVRLAGGSVAGFWSLLPPVAAIVLAILLREVLLALFVGVWTGALLLEGSLLQATLRTLDRHVIHAMRDPGHARILVFSCLIGAVVALVSRMGGIRAIVEGVARRGRTGRGAQLSTWLMGTLIFFDDYANALLVGNTMRPVSDRFRISREKLSFLVDCTAAPVACIAVISTWIATEISYIDGWLGGHPEGVAGYSSGAAYQIFLDTIPYSFYPVLCLAFAALVVVMGRDFGPMHRAEVRARTTGRVLGEGATPLISSELEAEEPADPSRLRWWNGALPILTVILVVVVGLYLDGLPAWKAELAAAQQEVAALEDRGGAALETARQELEALQARGFFSRLRQAYGRADSYNVLLWASFSGILVAWVLGLGQGLLTLRLAAQSTLRGIKAMIVACLVLVLAWALSDTCRLLNTSGFLIHQVTFSFELLPMAVFMLAAGVGFATGSSWSTMGILVPLTMSYAWQLGLEVGADPETLRQVLLASLGGVLAGAVFGDHCSPISDTTVMSSMAAGADHMDHVKTQLPYAMLVAAVAIVVGYLPAGFGAPPLLSLGTGLAALVLLLRVLGRRVPAGPSGGTP